MIEIGRIGGKSRNVQEFRIVVVKRVLVLGSGDFLFRGVMTSSRFRVLVVPTVGSCLEVITIVGMFVSGFGCRNWVKRRHMMDY